MFFTIDSNILLMVTCLLLAVWLTGWGTAFAVFRLAAVVGITITITGIVYYAVLKDLLDLHGAAYVSDFILHTVSPLMAIAGWLLLGPRRLTSPKVAGLVVIYPVLYLAVTLIRGPIVDWYPYPLLDVITHGYFTVGLNSLVVAALVLAVAFSAVWLDGRANGSPEPADQPPNAQVIGAVRRPGDPFPAAVRTVSGPDFARPGVFYTSTTTSEQRADPIPPRPLGRPAPGDGIRDPRQRLRARQFCPLRLQTAGSELGAFWISRSACGTTTRAATAIRGRRGPPAGGGSGGPVVGGCQPDAELCAPAFGDLLELEARRRFANTVDDPGCPWR